MGKILWTPEFYSGSDFKILLDREFATTMVHSRISSENQRRMNQVGTEKLAKLQVRHNEPYDFYEDSCLVREFILGGNGVALSINHTLVEELVSRRESDKPVTYHPHNAETSKDYRAISVLFSTWIQYADILRSSD